MLGENYRDASATASVNTFMNATGIYSRSSAWKTVEATFDTNFHLVFEHDYCAQAH